MYFMKKTTNILVTVLTLSCMLLGAAIITIKLTGLSSCTVNGHSMDDTLKEGEQLIVNSSAEPGFGDIIVFDYGGSYFVKRVIGMPGDVIKVLDGVLYINNVKYNEAYLSPGNTSGFKNSSFAAVINEDEYFVMGDNRDHSLDSRNFGCIPKDSVAGVVIWDFQ